jgi:hypothetical protein
VLAGLDGRLVVHRPKAGRSGQDHHVDVAVDHVAVGVEAGKDPILGQVNPLAELFLHDADRHAGPILEGVGHGNELDVLVLLQTASGHPIALTPAADQRNPYFVVTLDVGGPGDIQSAGQRRAGHHCRRTLQKITARRFLRFAHLVGLLWVVRWVEGIGCSV